MPPPSPPNHHRRQTDLSPLLSSFPLRPSLVFRKSRSRDEPPFVNGRAGFGDQRVRTNRVIERSVGEGIEDWGIEISSYFRIRKEEGERERKGILFRARGEDSLSSTNRRNNLYEFIGLPSPPSIDRRGNFRRNSIRDFSRIAVSLSLSPHRLERQIEKAAVGR